MEPFATRIKIGRLVGTASGFFLASALFFLVNMWTFVFCWALVYIGYALGGHLDRMSFLPEVSRRHYPVVKVATLFVAAAAPLAIRFAELHYHAAHIPIPSSMTLVQDSWRPLSGDSYPGFTLVFTTNEDAAEIYDYYRADLPKQGWQLRKEWPREREPDKFLVQFYSASGFLYLNYGSRPVPEHPLPAGEHYVVISYQLR